MHFGVQNTNTYIKKIYLSTEVVTILKAYSHIMFDIMKQGGNPVSLTIEFKYFNVYIFWHKCG